MTYERFVMAVKSLVKNIQENGNVEFSQDGGNFSAVFPDGTQITGTEESHRLSIRFGTQN